MHIVGCHEGWETWDRIDYTGKVMQVQEILEIDWAKGTALCRCTPLTLPSLETTDVTREFLLYKLELQNWEILEVELRVKPSAGGTGC
jgi:hypothetical protein